MSSSAVDPSVNLAAHHMQIVPTAEDKEITRLVVAVHGIGSQFRYSTVQSVAKQFAAYCGKPITQPLGAFHPAKLIPKPDSPEIGAYLFVPPDKFKEDFIGFGFAEVFWADIPERAADSKNTTEESKAWAQTIVDRVRMFDQSEGSTGKSDLIDYKKAAAVVEEMIDAIRVFENLLFVAKKAGLFEFKLGQLLTDFLGDVQIVADFKDYGGDIFKRFAETMKNFVQRMPNLKEIHIVAHSEGTVVSLKSILTALAAKEDPENEWVNKVKGYMTIGAPLNKHIVIWPNLWKGLEPEESRPRQDPILWRNYYDYGDPVGFDLEITREWLVKNKWLPRDGDQIRARYFLFSKGDDCGFTRYPFPGKAHNDYWNDDDVFGHFIKEVVLGKGKDKLPPPRGIWWAMIVSRIVPYILCLALLSGGIYVLYKTLVTVFKLDGNLTQMAQDVSGITWLLAGTTLLSRMPRLDKIWPGSVIGALAFVVGVYGYLQFASPGTQRLLSSAFWLPHYGIICACLIISLISAGLSKWRPRWGMIPLISLGGIAACMVLWHLLHRNAAALNTSLWPLVLANAGFLYLWWLSCLLFDLVYIWHQFICSRANRITKTLCALRKEAPEELKA
jgi:hypothetical protein